MLWLICVHGSSKRIESMTVTLPAFTPMQESLF
jgi:hypothetical protein